jgi:hypothetical protein
MKGYLLKEQEIIMGEDAFIESASPENNYVVVFEDDMESGYFYAAERNSETGDLRILDMVHIYDVESIDDKARHVTLAIVWSTDWLSCALVLDNVCHALFDFKNQGGYNLNEFPPPNSFWTKDERKLTNEIITRFFK